MSTVLTELARIPDLEVAVARAAVAFQLRARGWDGLESSPAASALKARCPDLRNAANMVSVISRNYQVLWSVVREASAEDRLEIRGYIIARLALERMSCHLSGAGAGSCDKLAAFGEILATSTFSL